MNSKSSITPQRKIRTYRFVRSVVARFYARQTLRSGLIWGSVYGVVVASSALSYAAAYPSAVSRQVLAGSLGANPGLRALLGIPRHIETVSGFAAWRSAGMLAIIGSIWALMTATKYFRNEEEKGRSEILQVGQTTARRAAFGTFIGLGSTLFCMYVVVALCTILVGHSSKVEWTQSASLFLALALLASTLVCMSIGALASQLMPTRGRAISLGVGVFGCFFLLRAIADSASALHWLAYVSPLGWIEQLHPLTGSQPLWLLPIFGFTGILVTLSVLLAGYRDLGEGIVRDQNTAAPHTKLLGSALGLSIRGQRPLIIGWASGIAVVCLLFGLVAKSAGEAFSASSVVQRATTILSGSATASGAKIFLGIIFFMLMVLLMAMVAGLMSGVRRDEAEGYLDNLLVRSVSRIGWIAGRIYVIGASIALMGLLMGIFTWLGTHSQHIAVSYGTLLAAGINAMVPGITFLGIGLLVFGIVPRALTTVMYALLAWSFLLEMIGSIINFNHWILDTSLVHHVALAPATSPNWHAVFVLLCVAIGTGFIGIVSFLKRDLITE